LEQRESILSTRVAALGASGPGIGAVSRHGLPRKAFAKASPNGTEATKPSQPLRKHDTAGGPFQSRPGDSSVQGLKAKETKSVQAAKNSVAFAEQNKSNWI